MQEAKASSEPSVRWVDLRGGCTRLAGRPELCPQEQAKDPSPGREPHPPGFIPGNILTNAPECGMGKREFARLVCG